MKPGGQDQRRLRRQPDDGRADLPAAGPRRPHPGVQREAVDRGGRAGDARPGRGADHHARWRAAHRPQPACCAAICICAGSGDPTLSSDAPGGARAGPGGRRPQARHGPGGRRRERLRPPPRPLEPRLSARTSVARSARSWSTAGRAATGEPAEFAAEVLARELRDAGVKVSVNTRLGQAPARAVVLGVARLRRACTC